jgi:hypothetical protein
MSIHQQRREIVDKLIDSRKKSSAEKRMQHSNVIYDPSLDENAWQIIQELGKQPQA